MSITSKCPDDVSIRIANMAVICSLLVVFAHSGVAEDGTALSLVKTCIYENLTFPVVVPFFSFVSGYFLARHMGEPMWYRREMQKRIRTLVVPYFFWLAAFFTATFGIGCAADVVRGSPLGSAFVNCFGGLSMWGWRALGLDLGECPLVAPLWYLRVVFVFVLLSPLAGRVLCRNRKFRLAILFLPMLMWLWLVTKVAPMLAGYFTWTVQVGYLWFFMLGIAVRRDAGFVLNRFVSILQLALAAAFMLFHIAGIRVMSSCGALQTLLVDGIKPICMTYFVWRLVPSWKLPLWLSSSSFAIYVMHCLFMAPWDIVFGRWPSANAALLIKFAMGSMGPVVLVNLMRTFCPQMVKLTLGGR